MVQHPRQSSKERGDTPHHDFERGVRKEGVIGFPESGYPRKEKKKGVDGKNQCTGKRKSDMLQQKGGKTWASMGAGEMKRRAGRCELQKREKRSDLKQPVEIRKWGSQMPKAFTQMWPDGKKKRRITRKGESKSCVRKSKGGEK